MSISLHLLPNFLSIFSIAAQASERSPKYVASQAVFGAVSPCPGVTARLTFDDQMLKIKGILGLTEIQFKYLKLSVVAFLVLVSFALGVMFSKSVAKVTRQFKRRKRVWSVVISYTAVKEEAKKAGWFGFLKSQKKKSSAKTTSLK